MMRKVLQSIIATSVFCFFGMDAFAQSTIENAAPARTLAPSLSNTPSARGASTVSCGTDTILYPYLKELAFSAPNDSFFIDAMVGNVRTASQGYDLNDNINIIGIQFWGAAYTTSTVPQSLPVKAYLYAVNAQFQPTTILDSATVTVTENYDFYEAIFSSPYAINTDFAVAVKSSVNDTLAVITNNAGASWQTTNYGEGLAWRRFGSGSWNSAVSFFGQDLEYMIFPIVSYSVTTSFTGPSMACANSAATFTNTSSPLYGNRMFNLLAFDDFWLGASDSTFTWDYGDGSPIDYMMNGSHTYTTGGSFNVELQGDMVGYYTMCTDSMIMAIQIMETTASFTTDLSQEPMVSFTNTSTTTGSNPTYMWDFGDSNTSTSQNPTNTYAANGTYTVTLTVTDSCGTDVATQTVTITTVGVNELSSVDIKALYNPVEQLLNVSLPGSANATIEVYNVVGALLYSESGINGSSKAIGLDGLTEGTYMVRVKTVNGIGAAKFVVIK